jgi:hypothetical protein
MPVFALEALPVGDYLVLGFLVAGFLVAGAARLIACLMRGTPEQDTEREHYSDDPDHS